MGDNSSRRVPHFIFMVEDFQQNLLYVLDLYSEISASATVKGVYALLADAVIPPERHVPITGAVLHSGSVTTSYGILVYRSSSTFLLAGLNWMTQLRCIVQHCIRIALFLLSDFIFLSYSINTVSLFYANLYS
jgi:hypothetical protein